MNCSSLDQHCKLYFAFCSSGRINSQRIPKLIMLAASSHLHVRYIAIACAYLASALIVHAYAWAGDEGNNPKAPKETEKSEKEIKKEKNKMNVLQTIASRVGFPRKSIHDYQWNLLRPIYIME